MERRADVYAAYGALVVFDPTANLPVDGFDADELRPWFSAHAVVLWEEEQGKYEVRIVDSLDGCKGLATQKAHLRCRGARLAVGSIEALESAEEASITLPARPGLYLVTVVEEDERRYAVHVAPVDEAPSRLLSGRLSKLGLPRRKLQREEERTVPLLRQLGLAAPEVTRTLASVARAVRAVPSGASGSWLYDGTLWVTRADEFADVRDVGAVWVTDVEASTLYKEYTRGIAASSSLRVRFRSVAGERRMYAWVAHTAGRHLLGVSVGLTGDAITDARLLLRPLSDVDQAECMRILRDEYAAAPAGVAVLERVKPVPAEATQTWTRDRLIVRYGPLRGVLPPKLKVTFETEGGVALEPATASVLRIEDDFAFYELWLVGPRQGCRRAVVSRL